jgi:hypothetical protein
VTALLSSEDFEVKVCSGHHAHMLKSDRRCSSPHSGEVFSANSPTTIFETVGGFEFDAECA